MSMDQIRIIEPPEKKFSWVNELIGIQPGEKAKTPIRYKSSVTPIISRDLKLKHPDAVFETDTTSEPEYLIIERKITDDEPERTNASTES